MVGKNGNGLAKSKGLDAVLTEMEGCSPDEVRTLLEGFATDYRAYVGNEWCYLTAKYDLERRGIIFNDRFYAFESITESEGDGGVYILRLNDESGAYFDFSVVSPRHMIQLADGDFSILSRQDHVTGYNDDLNLISVDQIRTNNGIMGLQQMALEQFLKNFLLLSAKYQDRQFAELSSQP